MNTLKTTAQQSGMATQRKIALAIYVAAVIGLGVLSLPLLFAFFIPMTVAFAIALFMKPNTGVAANADEADDAEVSLPVIDPSSPLMRVRSYALEKMLPLGSDDDW